MDGREGERGGRAGLGFCGVAVAAAAAKKEKAVFLFRPGIECDVKVPLASPLSHTTKLTGSKQSFLFKVAGSSIYLPVEDT